jgi:hypothetical protein
MKEYLKNLAKSVGKFLIRYPLATALTVVVIIGAIVLAAFGKNIQIGGILGKLWGKEKPNLRGVPPTDRKDASGQIIQPGQSDDKGFVQAPVSTTIKDKGLFSDPNVITVIHPDKGEIDILLPEGVKNKDVKEVTEVSPNVFEVKNHDHGVKTDDILKTLGT